MIVEQYPNFLFLSSLSIKFLKLSNKWNCQSDLQTLILNLKHKH